MLEGIRGSPRAPRKMASKSRASMLKPSGGIVVPSFRNRSADQSKVVNSTGAPVASTTFIAAGITSLPMPSPGMTAIFFAGMKRKIYHGDTETRRNSGDSLIKRDYAAL